VASEAWNEVLEMDKLTKSRDQNRFNEVCAERQLLSSYLASTS